MTGPQLDVQGAIASFTEAARSQGWTVSLQKPLGGHVPDMVAAGPSGSTYVIEFKTSEHALHFGAIAQVASTTGTAAQMEEFRGRPVRGVLVTSGGVAPTVAKVADELGVMVIRLEPAQAGETGRHLLDLLDKGEPN